MNDEDFGVMIREREIFELLARGATEADWPRLWEQAERSARAGATAVSSYNPESVYRSLARESLDTTEGAGRAAETDARAMNPGDIDSRAGIGFHCKPVAD